MECSCENDSRFYTLTIFAKTQWYVFEWVLTTSYKWVIVREKFKHVKLTLYFAQS